jgi:uracil-DNA glycosylase
MLRHHEYLSAMDVDIWVRRDAAPTSMGTAAPTSVSAAKELSTVAASVAVCVRCDLHRTRTQTVFGVGNPNADWLIIGEAPGAEEDRRGEPFVGRAGQLLNSMLQAVGLSREQAYIANILKCRPPGNRDPQPEEVALCSSYLAAQVELIGPRIILALGRVAAQNLLQRSTPIGKMRGQRYTYGETAIPVIVTYHPAYLLRSPQEKRKVWRDLLLAKETLEESMA